MSFTPARTRLPATVPAIAVGRGISFLGDEVALLAMAFRANAELGHFGVAAILIAGMLPLLVLSPFAGLLVDRVRTRPLLVAVTLLQAGLCVALAYSSSALLVPLIALLACGTVVASPAWSALVPTLLESSQLPSAMGLLQSAQAIAGIAGPFVGGLLVASFGFHVPLLADAASFVVLAAMPIALRVDRKPSREGTPGSTWHEAFRGVHLLFTDPLLRALFVMLACFVLALGAINVVEIYFVTTALHAGPFGYGLLGCCMGGGMLVVASMSGVIARRFTQPERLMAVGCVGLCVGICAFGLTTELWQAAVLVTVLGAFNAIVNVNAQVLLTLRSSDELRGRVFAAIQGAMSAAQILALSIGGLLLLAFGPRSIILVASACCAVTLALTIAPVLRAGAASPLSAQGGGEDLTEGMEPARA
jgi:MFS family permease